MIVQRSTLKVKQGRMEEAVALVLAAAERERSAVTRVYTIDIGQRDRLAIEWEFENLAAYEQYWTEWRAKPTYAEFRKKWYEILYGGETEIWRLVEKE